MKEEFGAIVEPPGLMPAVKRLLNDHNLPKMRLAARSYALSHRFSDQATRLAKIVHAEVAEFF
jgi:hypothetical protein